MDVKPFTVAVVEYSPHQYNVGLTPAQYMNKNLDNYEEFVKNAFKKEVDLIVFPEYGITSDHIQELPLSEFDKFSIEIPNIRPNEEIEHSDGNNQSIIARIRTLAKQYRMYVVVNMAEKMSSPDATTSYNYYNTALAFDREGNIVARYPKYHLYVEKAMSRSDSVDISYFDTDVGLRVGLFICFDINYKEPGRTLVDNHKVDIVAFPMAWIDELPFLTAIQFHSGWATANNVVVLASNYLKTEKGGIGSGIFGPKGDLNYIRCNTERSQMLISRLSQKQLLSMESSTKEIPSTCDAERDEIFYLYENLSQYNHIVLEAGQHSVELNQNGFKCKIRYHLDNNNNNNEGDAIKYIFLVRSGPRTFCGGRFTAGIQVCGILACHDYDPTLKNCGKIIQKDGTKKVFRELRLEGTFDSGVRPNPSGIDHQVRLLQNLAFANNNNNNNNFSLEITAPATDLFSLSLYGRDFTLDTN